MSDQQTDNPYPHRDHEAPVEMQRDDVLAVASLLGQVTGSLREIDKQNVGGQGNQFIKAAKIDAKEALKNIVGANTSKPVAAPQPTAPPPQMTTPQQVPQMSVPLVPQPPQQSEPSDLERRVTALEKIVETFKSPMKFKRGISYSVSTSKISAEFKDPSLILDIIATELAKNTKTITLKLNDKSKN